MKLNTNVLKAMTLLAFAFGSLELHAKEQRVLVKMKNQAVFQMLSKSQFLSSNLQNSTRIEEAQQKKQIAAVFPNVQMQLEDSLNHLTAMVATVSSESDLEKLRKNPNVEYVDVEVFHPAPKPAKGFLYSPLAEGINKAAETSQTPWGIKAVKAMEAWKISDMGQKSRVLVLDTGIDKNHPAIKGNFEAGRNFAGELTVNAEDYADTEGHGTHVSGTIAGVLDSSGFSGVAPKAKLLMGRVCAKEGCSNIAISKGINWGIEKKVDVISMSLGGAFSTPSERDAIARAYSSGITLVAATGNEGTEQVSYPAALDEVIAVGATDSEGKRGSFSQYGPELAVMAPGVDVMSSVPMGTGRASKVQLNLDGQNMAVVNSTAFSGSRAITEAMENQLVYAGLGRPEDFSQVNVAGKFALIKRGEIRFGEKAQNAIRAGALGVIIFNNIAGNVRGSLTEDGSEMSVPVFGVDQEAGEQALKVLEGGKVVNTRVAIETTDYAAFDGTSMATPHVSGVVALMKSANRSLSPSQVKEILKSTATRVEPNPNNEYGSGIVNAEEAVKAALKVTAPDANTGSEADSSAIVHP